MTIDRLTPAKEVLWQCHGDNPEWAGTTLTWGISRGDGTTVLRFTHSGWRAVTDLYAICNSSWGELMLSAQRLRGRQEFGTALERMTGTK